MLVRVKEDQAALLRQLEVTTYEETFGPYIKKADMEHYFAHELSLEKIEQDLKDPQSETYFVMKDQEIAGFLKFNWGAAQTEPVDLERPFEVHRIYVLEKYHGLGLGKEMFEFALEQAQKRGFVWTWLGVWEKNFKAQNFYFKYGFERFSEHEYVTGDTVDIDWLLAKKL
ncbi:GNAT family N-acetyltransferase [Streptococcus oricebi]|uniref:GNAT family N-acetyltransferase n=1 Tax=Streptococcus oricebi TaxID=1547447 RepID=A0ABS5B3P6_9STRE|nr:GNAT family N-acetyltransferase [Streptococcus oricebi]MBP2622594.1 GNAT family N-acetyltransferase [Streptococcus oricebi]